MRLRESFYERAHTQLMDCWDNIDSESHTARIGKRDPLLAIVWSMQTCTAVMTEKTYDNDEIERLEEHPFYLNDTGVPLAPFISLQYLIRLIADDMTRDTTDLVMGFVRNTVKYTIKDVIQVKYMSAKENS